MPGGVCQGRERCVPFEVIPAIDLRAGRVVRLRRGDFDDETVYGNDPAATATRFAAAGARWIHVVDLDGARDGSPQNSAAIAAILAVVAGIANGEIAGGLRTPEAIAATLAAGAARVVVGTAALRDAAFVRTLIATYGPARIAVAIDVRDGLAIGEGWRPGASGPSAEAAVELLADAGVTVFEATAINMDGVLGGPDLGLLGRLVGLHRGSVIASGGIASLADIRAVAEIGCGGAIVGRAIYDGRITVEDAISVAASFGGE